MEQENKLLLYTLLSSLALTGCAGVAATETPLPTEEPTETPFPTPDLTATIEDPRVNTDSDGDGLPDSWEEEHFESLEYGPLDDPDEDGLDNQDEYHGMIDLGWRDREGNRFWKYFPSTNPLSWDTDGDGLSDGEEVRYQNPEFGDYTDPTLYDTDEDGISDKEEKENQTNPLDPDSN